MYGVPVDKVSAMIGKSVIATGYMVLHITLTCQRFEEIPNVLMCHEKRMLVVVKGCRPFWWLGAYVKGMPGEEYNNTATTYNYNKSSNSNNRDWKGLNRGKERTEADELTLTSATGHATSETSTTTAGVAEGGEVVAETAATRKAATEVCATKGNTTKAAA